ncbi:MAG: CGNR zinc finger domain-containing protein [Actinomycetota bacterium]
MKFKFVGGNLCLDFINTVGDHLAAKRYEYLKSYTDLLSWAVAAEIFSDAEKERLLKTANLNLAKANRTLKNAIKLREVLFQMLLAMISEEDCPPELLKLFNDFLAETLKYLQLEQPNGKFSFDWKNSKANLEQIIWIITWSAANLLVNENLKYLKVCADNACGWLFLDTSKNKKRAWCDMKDCGNRNKLRRYYSKNKSDLK